MESSVSVDEAGESAPLIVGQAAISYRIKGPQDIGIGIAPAIRIGGANSLTS
jgi:hypothetical protein